MTAQTARWNGSVSPSDGLDCERCTSADLRWLTPRDRVHEGAMLFCASCGHLNIITRRRMMAAAATLLAA